jgi:hypothetical protein
MRTSKGSGLGGFADSSPFVYANTSPHNFNDPSGLAPEKDYEEGFLDTEVENTDDWYAIQSKFNYTWALELAALEFQIRQVEDAEKLDNWDRSAVHNQSAGDKNSNKTGKKTKGIFSKIGDAISDLYNAVEDWAKNVLKNVFTSGDEEEEGGQSELSEEEKNAPDAGSLPEVLVKPKGEHYSLLYVYMYAKFGNGDPLYVDISTYDWSMIKISDFDDVNPRSINTFLRDYLSTEGFLFGTLLFEYIGEGEIKVVNYWPEGDERAGQLYFDTFNFNHQENVSPIRNSVTRLGYVLMTMPWLAPNIPPYPIMITYGYTPFRFYFNGTAKIGGN